MARNNSAEAVAESAPAGKSDRELLLLVLERLGQQQAAIDCLSAAVQGQAQAAGPSEPFIKRRSAVCGMTACQRRSLALESCVRGPPTLIEHMGTRPAATSMLPPDASAPCASDKMSDAELSSLAKRLHDENVLQDTPRPSSPRDKLEKLTPAGEAGDSTPSAPVSGEPQAAASDEPDAEGLAGEDAIGAGARARAGTGVGTHLAVRVRHPV